MSRTWTCGDLEFVVRWEALRHDDLPPPLSWASNLNTGDELDSAKIQALEALRLTDDQSFRKVMHVVAQPDIWIGLRVMDGKDRDNVRRSIRLLGVRRGEWGYVVRQLPGETIWHSAGFVTTECQAVGLAGAMVAQVPEVPAGRMGDLLLDLGVGRGGTTDDSYGTSAVFDSFYESRIDEVERFLAAPVEAVGVITVSQGESKFGPRGLVQRRLVWRDLKDDGRYVVDDQHTPMATAADAATLTAMINARVAEIVRAIREERS